MVYKWKNYLSFLVLILGVLSWSFGLYVMPKFYTPTLIIPTINNYYWVDRFTALLGLTLIFTVVIGLVYLVSLKKKQYKNPWLIGSSNLLWVLILLAQLKIVAYNLGICH